MFSTMQAYLTAIEIAVVVAVGMVIIYAICGSLDYDAITVAFPILVGLVIGALDDHIATKA